MRMKILQHCKKTLKGALKFVRLFFVAAHNFDTLAVIALYFASGIGAGYVFLINQYVLFCGFITLAIFFLVLRIRFLLYIITFFAGAIYFYSSSFFNLKFYDNKDKEIIVDGYIENIRASRYREYVILSDVKSNFIPCNKIKLQKDKNFQLDSRIGDRVTLHVVVQKFNYLDSRFLYYNKVNHICSGGKILGVISTSQTYSKNIFDGLIKRFRKKIYNSVSESDRSSGGGILLALTIGNTGFIKKHDLENIRKIGIAHVLAISGLHLSILSGFIYLGTRKFIVIFCPRLALEYNIKKFATIPVFIFLFIYLHLSGVSISAIRSFVMITLYFFGTLLDVRTCPVKILASAFIVCLLINPAYLFHPSFQMSFVAVLALIQSYGFINHYFIFHKIFPKLISYIINIELSSIAATFATSFFEIYHFEQYSMIGLVANPLILPIVEFFILPVGFIGIFMPLKTLEHYFYFLSGTLGGNLVVYVAEFLSKSYGFFVMPRMKSVELCGITIGLVWLFLARDLKFKLFSTFLLVLFFCFYLTRTLLL